MATVTKDFAGVLKKVYDPATEALRTTTTASVDLNVDDITITHVDDSIKVGDGTDFLAINPDGSINVNVNDIVISHASDSIKIGDGTDFLAVNSDGSINTVVDNTATVSVGNSTTATLGSGGVFTGAWESILDFGSVAVIVYSNVSSAAQGLELQFSSDGSNLDITEKYFYDSSHSNGDLFIVPTKAQYFRIKYTNGGSAQSSFRLQVTYRLNVGGPTNLINSAIYDSSPSSTTRSVIVGKTTAGGGDYVNVKVNPSGALTVAASQDGTWNINNISGTISLPTGAATAANQTTGNASLSSIDTKLPSGMAVTGDRLKVDVTGTVDAGTGFPQLTVSNAIFDEDYDLQAANYNATSNITTDYILDHISINFSNTSESKHIVITGPDGSTLWEGYSGSSYSVVLEEIEQAFDANDNFQISIDQTAGACLAYVTAVIKTGSATLGGNPAVTQSGTWTVGLTNEDYITAVDLASSTVTYVGKAAPGTTTATAGWRIARYTVTGNVTLQAMADGNSNYDNVWDNRAILSYS